MDTAQQSSSPAVGVPLRSPVSQRTFRISKAERGLGGARRALFKKRAAASKTVVPKIDRSFLLQLSPRTRAAPLSVKRELFQRLQSRGALPSYRKSLCVSVLIFVLSFHIFTGEGFTGLHNSWSYFPQSMLGGRVAHGE